MADENKTIQSNLTSTSTLTGTVALSSIILTNATRIKLKDLGIETDDIKTEEEGRKILDETESILAEEKAEKERAEKQKQADNNIHYRLRKLAREMGIVLNEYEPVSKMLEKMARKVRELNSNKQEETFNLKSNKHKNEYQDILNRYLTSQKEQQKLDDNLTTIAYYNKLYQQMNMQ